MVSQDLVGTSGTLAMPTRGDDGPGEVMLKVNGVREAFLATSAEPLPRGSHVLVVECLPHRKVVVVPWPQPPTGEPLIDPPSTGEPPPGDLLS